MNAYAVEVAILSPECEKLLAEREWYAEPSRVGGPGTTLIPRVATIRDEEGMRLFDVSLVIDAFDLAQLLRHADTQYRKGAEEGAADLKRCLRALIGAAESTE